MLYRLAWLRLSIFSLFSAVCLLVVSCAHLFDSEDQKKASHYKPSGEPRKAVIILYSPIGAGHVSAAKTIQQDLQALDPQRLVLLKNIREFTKPLLGSKEIADQTDKSAYMAVFTHFPSLYDRIFHRVMDVNIAKSRLEAGEVDIEAPELMQFIRSVAAYHDLSDVLSTHYMGARTLGQLRSQGQFNSPRLKQVRLSWLNTDYFVGYFPRISQFLDHTFLAHPQLAQLWVKRGVPADRVSASGLPMAEQFAAASSPTEKATTLQGLGFKVAPNTYTLTIATGGTGIGRFDRMLDSLVQAFPKPVVTLQIIAVPAENQQNYDRLVAMQSQLPSHIRLKVCKGLIPKNDLLSYLQASDLYLTKAGGLSPTEAFLTFKPTILLNIFQGHEKENAHFFQHLNLAELADTYEDIGPKARLLLLHKEQRDKALAAQQAFAASFKKSVITDYLLAEKLPETQQTPHTPKSIIASGKLALRQLNHSFPSEVELYLSYSLIDEKDKITNPFGHIALRLGKTVYTTDADATHQHSDNLLVALAETEYLFGKNSEKTISHHKLADTEGQVWGRNLLSLRIQGLDAEALNKMLAKISQLQAEFKAGRIRYSALKCNCSHHVLSVLEAGGLKLKKLTSHNLTHLPLEIFTKISDSVADKKLPSKYVFYQQIYDFDDFILPEFRFKLSRFPLQAELLPLLNWWFFDKIQPLDGELEANTDLRLAYYPDGRYVFENIRTYKTNDFIAEQQKPQRTVVIPTFDDGPLNRSLWSKSQKACPSREDFLRPLGKILEQLAAAKITGVFYVNGWANIDLDASCSTRNEKALRGLFQEGLRRIYRHGHLVALHSFDHLAYRDPHFDEARLRQDITKLRTEIETAHIPLTPLWRTPYGSHELLQQSLQEPLHLTARGWKLDSFDYLAHDDSPVKGLFASAWLQELATQVGFAYTSRFSRTEEDETYYDILFHVNEQSAKNLASLLKAAQTSLEKNKHADFSNKGNFYWLQSTRTQEFKNYLENRG